jgi:hypothetical protein
MKNWTKFASQFAGRFGQSALITLEAELEGSSCSTELFLKAIYSKSDFPYSLRFTMAEAIKQGEAIRCLPVLHENALLFPPLHTASGDQLDRVFRAWDLTSSQTFNLYSDIISAMREVA